MISYYSRGTEFRPKFITKINRWVQSFSKNKGYSRLSLNYVFCSDDEMLKLNRDFLEHDYFTDIITFDTIDDQRVRKNALAGDIFISVDTLKANSVTYGVTFENEMLRVMIHGVLHLMGFDDHTPEEEKEIHRQEDAALELFYGKKI